MQKLTVVDLFLHMIENFRLSLTNMTKDPSPKKRPRVATTASDSISAVDSIPRFNDPSTADVILRLRPQESISAVDPTSELLHLHSHILLQRSNYFSTLLSDRWQSQSPPLNNNNKKNLTLTIPPNPAYIHTYTTALQLIYTLDFTSVIDSVSTALSLLPVALELLFEDCVKHCVRFLEAVPWTEEEEGKIVNLIPFLKEEESEELVGRVCCYDGEKKVGKCSSSEEMLNGLIKAALHSHPNMASAKAFVAKLLRDFSSKESARRVLDLAFIGSLKVVREAMEEYSSPDFRGDHNETEAIQRLNLHTAMTNGRHLLWLVERMVELRVADVAVEEWSDLSALTADLQRAFRDDAWRNIVPGLPAVMLRCTCKLANAVAAGIVLPCRQVRMKLVKDWLPVLIVCKDNVSPMVPGHKSLHSELEETFLKIISTLPMSDAQELLQQCLSFSTRNADDCPHLITAFNTWFRRANRHLDAENRDA